jgi:hypothetical protein
MIVVIKKQSGESIQIDVGFISPTIDELELIDFISSSEQIDVNDQICFDGDIWTKTISGNLLSSKSISSLAA